MNVTEKCLIFRVYKLLDVMPNEDYADNKDNIMQSLLLLLTDKYNSNEKKIIYDREMLENEKKYRIFQDIKRKVNISISV